MLSGALWRWKLRKYVWGSRPGGMGNEMEDSNGQFVLLVTSPSDSLDDETFPSTYCRHCYSLGSFTMLWFSLSQHLMQSDTFTQNSSRFGTFSSRLCGCCDVSADTFPSCGCNSTRQQRHIKADHLEDLCFGGAKEKCNHLTMTMMMMRTFSTGSNFSVEAYFTCAEILNNLSTKKRVFIHSSSARAEIFSSDYKRFSTKMSQSFTRYEDFIFSWSSFAGTI